MTNDLLDTRPAAAGRDWNIIVPGHPPDLMVNPRGTVFGVTLRIQLGASAQQQLQEAYQAAQAERAGLWRDARIEAVRDGREQQAAEAAASRLRAEEQRQADLESRLAREQQAAKSAILAGRDADAAEHQTAARALRQERDEAAENLPAYRQRVEDAKRAAERALADARREVEHEIAQALSDRFRAARDRLRAVLADALTEVLICDMLRR